ncbi:DNA/RNA non-specific endonuclease [Arthrobacter rhombi]|uniref:DNA/RNA non-specific endonuclease n=1 Tax=Arthrobacter rhombi TaxID=71253 RepID=UPI003FD09FBC
MELEKTGGLGEGFNPCFLHKGVDTPLPSEAVCGDLLVWEEGTVLPYTHFSLAMSIARRFAYWVAWNIDGSALKRLSRQGIDFVYDQRIPATAQTGNDLYAGNRLDRGHLARRADLTWGSTAEAKQANKDSFTYTNITPQMDDFNQSSRQGLWGRLEDALYADVEIDELRASAIAGPVFGNDDQVYRGVGIPREYWKILAYCQNGALRVSAFLLTQDLDQLRVLTALDEFRLYQVSLVEVQERTGLIFGAGLHAADGYAQTSTAVRGEIGERSPLKDISEICW